MPQTAPSLDALRDYLAMVAELMLRDGAAWAPLFERIERDIAEREANNDPIARARRLIAERKAAA